MAELEDGRTLVAAAMEAMPLVIALVLIVLMTMLYRVWARPTWGRFGNGAFIHTALIVVLGVLTLVAGVQGIAVQGAPLPMGVLWVTMTMWATAFLVSSLFLYLVLGAAIVALRRRKVVATAA